MRRAGPGHEVDRNLLFDENAQDPCVSPAADPTRSEREPDPASANLAREVVNRSALRDRLQTAHRTTALTREVERRVTDRDDAVGTCPRVGEPAAGTITRALVRTARTAAPARSSGSHTSAPAGNCVACQTAAGPQAKTTGRSRSSVAHACENSAPNCAAAGAGPTLTTTV